MMFSSKYANHSSELAGFDCSSESFGSLVRSEFAQDCDINCIMQRYARTGIIDHVSTAQAVFCDVSELGDYDAMASRVARAGEAFMALPAEVRFLAGGSPANLASVLTNPANADILRKYGMLTACDNGESDAPAGVVSEAS